jgi:hypothetical protein
VSLTEKAAHGSLFLLKVTAALVSDNLFEERHHSLVDSFSHFHHTTVGIVRRHIWRKTPAFEIRYLWLWQRQTARNQSRS